MFARLVAALTKKSTHETAQSADSNTVPQQLSAALEKTLQTCLLGSANKIADLEKTNGFTLFHTRRFYVPGCYVKLTNQFDLYSNLFNANNVYDPQERNVFIPQKTWYYMTDSPSTLPRYNLRARFDDLNPAQDSRFNLNNGIKILLSLAMLTAHIRMGNCNAKAALFAKFLWEQADSKIKRIEICDTHTFDHCLVIINREGDLHDSSTWGNAWIVDPWFGKQGLIFTANEFAEKIIQIKNYAGAQLEMVEEIGLSCQPIRKDEPEKLRHTKYEINLKKNLYPTYSTNPFYPLEHYYLVENIYPSGFLDRHIIYFRDHQTHFFPSLKRIRGLEDQEATKPPLKKMLSLGII